MEHAVTSISIDRFSRFESDEAGGHILFKKEAADKMMCFAGIHDDYLAKQNSHLITKTGKKTKK